MSDDGWVELTGDDIPYHLRLDAPPLGECNRCHRQTWAESELGTEDRMPQPDGNPCGGQIIYAPQTAVSVIIGGDNPTADAIAEGRTLGDQGST